MTLPLGRTVLSHREHEVLLWAARGKTINETASIIGSRPCTVQRQRQSATAKFAAINTVQAVAMALACGEIQFGEFQTARAAPAAM